jgi:hypothetical protein
MTKKGPNNQPENKNTAQNKRKIDRKEAKPPLAPLPNIENLKNSTHEINDENTAALKVPAKLKSHTAKLFAEDAYLRHPSLLDIRSKQHVTVNAHKYENFVEDEESDVSLHDSLNEIETDRVPNYAAKFENFEKDEVSDVSLHSSLNDIETDLVPNYTAKFEDIYERRQKDRVVEKNKKPDVCPVDDEEDDDSSQDTVHIPKSFENMTTIPFSFDFGAGENQISDAPRIFDHNDKGIFNLLNIENTITEYDEKSSDVVKRKADQVMF